ncbi:hypothetical protein I4300191C4_01090 [Solibaculum mannosilyticum]
MRSAAALSSTMMPTRAIRFAIWSPLFLSPAQKNAPLGAQLDTMVLSSPFSSGGTF